METVLGKFNSEMSTSLHQSSASSTCPCAPVGFAHLYATIRRTFLQSEFTCRLLLYRFSVRSFGLSVASSIVSIVRCLSSPHLVASTHLFSLLFLHVDDVERHVSFATSPSRFQVRFPSLTLTLKSLIIVAKPRVAVWMCSNRIHTTCKRRRRCCEGVSSRWPRWTTTRWKAKRQATTGPTHAMQFTWNEVEDEL